MVHFFCLGHLVALSLSTAVVKIVLSDSHEHISTDAVMVQLFKLYKLEAILKALESFVATTKLALEQSLRGPSYYDDSDFDSTKDGDDDDLDLLVSFVKTTMK